MEGEEKSFDAFVKRFEVLADDAKQHGLSVVVILENADPISRGAGYFVIRRGSAATTEGLLSMASSGRI